jgi:tripartite-type tricarboxylate transporter receptor subunit TctC
MNRQILRLFVFGITILLSLNFVQQSEGSSYPEKPITIICPFAAGASYDMTSRAIANVVTKLIGQPVVVMNKTGGGTFVANAEIYNAEPDGYTLIINASSSLCLSPHLRKAPFDPWKLTPIMSYGIYPILVAVRADSPFKTFKDMMDFIKKKPGELKIATSGGPDVMENLPMYILQSQEKMDFKFVPYEGGAPAAAAVLGGHVPAMTGGGGAIVHIRDGKMRGLVAFTSRKLTGLPEIPTAKELGYDIVVESRYALYGPPGVSKDIVKKLEETFKKAMDDEDFKKIADSFRMTLDFKNSEEIDKYHRDLSSKIRKILIEVGRIKE